MDLLIVENAKTGETYAVPPAHFRKELEPNGFKAVRHESGADYSYTPPSSKAADKADKA